MNLIFSIVGLAAMISAGVAVGVGEQFSANVLFELAREKLGESVVVSPMSLLFPLVSLSLASEGVSRYEILNAIGMPNNNVAQVDMSNLVKQLKSLETGVELKLANRIYIAQDAELNQEFIKSSIGLDIGYKNIDFGDALAVREINYWVEEQTGHRILNLLSESDVNAATQAVIVNAIYFQGRWSNKFDKNETKLQNFYSNKGWVLLPTMIGKFNFQYAESAELDAKILEMSYEGMQSSLLIVLPNRLDGVSNLQEKLRDASVLSNAIKGLKLSNVDVSLPKFKIETSSYLDDLLKQLGVYQIFTSNANLQYLLQDNSRLSISKVIQKASIEVNEDGATAAAATAAVYATAIWGNLLDKRTFVADHPFVFYLRVQENILFSGVFQG